MLLLSSRYRREKIDNLGLFLYQDNLFKYGVPITEIRKAVLVFAFVPFVTCFQIFADYYIQNRVFGYGWYQGVRSIVKHACVIVLTIVGEYHWINPERLFDLHLVSIRSAPSDN